jgi:hypothetical protein
VKFHGERATHLAEVVRLGVLTPETGAARFFTRFREARAFVWRDFFAAFFQAAFPLAFA